MSQEFKFKVESFRKNPSPYESKKEQASYTIICDVKKLPIDIPIKNTNPREQNFQTAVAREIKKSLLEDENFWLLNRGILFSVESVSYDNSKQEVTMIISDEDRHGNVDGGHTYQIINKHKINIGDDFPITQQFVKLEIVTDVESFFEDLAGARNTSNQVDLKSLSELQGCFQLIKNSLKNECFLEKIAFKQYEQGKKIDAREVIALISMFNKGMFDEKSQPNITYSGKEVITRRYVKEVSENPEDNSYLKMVSLIPDIFKLYEHLEKNMPEFYTQNKDGKKYGALKEIKTPSDLKTLFYEETISYETPKGFIYPILASIRALIEYDENGNAEWMYHPYECLNDLGHELVIKTIDRSKSLGGNPQSVGKDSGHWATLYSLVENYALKKKLEEMMK